MEVSSRCLRMCMRGKKNISKRASEQTKEVYVTTVCYIILINQVADGETQPIIAPKPHYSQ